MKRTSLPVISSPSDASQVPPVTPTPLTLSAMPERCDESDLFHDYVLEQYEPRVPSLGKLRSIELLFASFALVGLEREGRAVVDLVRRGLGGFRTIWGVKHDAISGAVKGWELYFYDWKRAHADLSIPRLIELLSPALNIDAVEPRPLPWHMFSIEFSPADLASPRSRTLPVHVYIDMRSYELAGRSFVFENVYTFHDPKAEIDDIVRRLKASVHVDFESDALARLLPPSLLRCHRVCVANKRLNDALYFSRVPTTALQRFLVQRNYPEPLVRWVDDARNDLDHLLWDVGVDFDAIDGEPMIRRTGFYGSF